MTKFGTEINYTVQGFYICVICAPYSGSKYATEYFKKRGLRFVHEDLGEDGIVGWQMLFEDLQGFNEVWHLVRHPLRCISSLCDLGKHHMNDIAKVLNTPVSNEVTRFCEARTIEGNEVSIPETVMSIWLGMNKIAEEKSDKIILVENLRDKDLPTNLNSKTRTEFEWEDLFKANSDLANKIISMGRRYGYEIEGV